MSKHTPGPWHVFTPIEYVGPEDVPSLGIDADNGDAVVWYGRGAEQGIANDADAHLIAAAPELLDALEMLLLHCRTPWTVQCAKEAIAKATGDA